MRKVNWTGQRDLQCLLGPLGPEAAGFLSYVATLHNHQQSSVIAKQVYVKEHKERRVSSVQILLPGDFDLNSQFFGFQSFLCCIRDYTHTVCEAKTQSKSFWRFSQSKMTHDVHYLNGTGFSMKGGFENELRKKLKFFHQRHDHHQRMVTIRGMVATRTRSPPENGHHQGHGHHQRHGRHQKKAMFLCPSIFHSLPRINTRSRTPLSSSHSHHGHNVQSKGLLPQGHKTLKWATSYSSGFFVGTVSDSVSKKLAAKPGNVSSIPEAHMMEERTKINSYSHPLTRHVSWHTPAK